LLRPFEEEYLHSEMLTIIPNVVGCWLVEGARRAESVKQLSGEIWSYSEHFLHIAASECGVRGFLHYSIVSSITAYWCVTLLSPHVGSPVYRGVGNVCWGW
jgi:hypothetical protein